MVKSRMPRAHGLIVTGGLALLSHQAVAGGTTSWNFDESTSGEDVFWTSPSPVADDAPRYAVGIEVSTVEVTVTFLGLPFVYDATADLPPEQLGGSTIEIGPPPIVASTPIVFPDPPEPTSIALTLTFETPNADGFGTFAITDITFGTVTVDIPIFGTQTLPIDSIRAAGTLSLRPLGIPADVNDDGFVNFDDLLLVLAGWGACPANQACFSDASGDGMTGFDDLIIVLSNWDAGAP
jgi:hypothetical protein